VSPLTGTEQARLSDVERLTTTTPPTEQAASDLVRRILGGEFLNPASNPFLQSTYDAAARPLMRNWEDVIMPNLRSGFTQGGHMIQSSSPYLKAVEQAGTRQTENLADLAARIFGGAYGQERGLMQQAIPFGADLGGQDLRRATIGLQLAGLPRQIEQMGIDKALEQFNRNTGLQLTATQIAGMLSQPQTVTTQTAGAPSTFQQILGGATQAALPFALTGFNPFAGISDLFGSFGGGGAGPFNTADLLGGASYT
jgi:hypothetical protein